MTELMLAAKSWAEMGVPVFPCRLKGKEPATAHWREDATVDPERIEGWWTEGPRLNVGGAMGGELGWWVLDLDGEVGIASLAELEARNGPLPETMTVTTGGGGRHLFFRVPPGVEIRNSSGKIGEKIDVRGDGGYVVLAPSVHPNGRSYELANGVRTVAEAPAWLVALATAKKEKAQAQTQRNVMDTLFGSERRPDGAGSNDAARLAGIVRAACERIRAAVPGTRNNTVNEECYAVGGWLDGLGGSVDLVAPTLEEAALVAEQSPAMVRRSLEDGRRTSRGRPPDEDSRPGASAPAGPPRWLLNLREAVETGAVKALYEDDDALVGVVEPGIHGGETEALLEQLPHQVRASLRRAGKAIIKARRTDRKAPRIAKLPLIVQHGPTWWLLDSDRYLSVISSLAAVEVGRLNKGVDTTVATESGSRYMSSTEVYGVHGVTARRVAWTYDATGPAWDPVGRVLRIPGARVSVGPAVRSEQVEWWLARLVPTSQLDKLLDWLATAALLDRPTSAPQLRGPDSAGKAMLAAALTTWLGGRVDYKHATGDFNAGLIFGPLVLLDEGVAESMPDIFRSLTGNREHQVVEKGRMPEELVGCPRVLVTSNEQDPLKLGREELSSHSEHALGRRILVFDVQATAAEYLAELGGFDATAGWCLPDGELVCHLRWLAVNREVVHGRRFLVEGDAAAWVSSAHLRAGVAGDIVQAYVAYRDLEEEGRTSSVNQPYPFYYSQQHPAQVGINVGGLKANWQLLVGDAKVPSHQRLSSALRRLSGQEVPTRPRVGGGEERGPRVYLVSIAKLMSDDPVPIDAGPGCRDG